MQEIEYNLNLKNFNGPFDLLLHLLKNKKMDLLTINLVEVIDDYVDFFDKCQGDIDHASKYLVMASKLLYLKSRMLLNIPNQKEAIAIDKKTIIRKLAEYQQFKKIAHQLRNFELERNYLIIKPNEAYQDYQKKISITELSGKSSLKQLVSSLQKILQRTNAIKKPFGIISTINLSPEECGEEILKLLATKKELEFYELFDVDSIKHFVVTWLAILDLARLQKITIIQGKQFANLKIKKVG